MSNNTSDPRRSHDEVARAAYERFLARGQEHGSDLDDWLAAERAVDPPPEAVARQDDAGGQLRAPADGTAAGSAPPRRRHKDRAPASSTANAPRVTM